MQNSEHAELRNRYIMTAVGSGGQAKKWQGACGEEEV